MTAEHPVDRAIQEGGVAPARREAYRRAYDADPEGTAHLLASLPPAVPLGSVGGAEPEYSRP